LAVWLVEGRASNRTLSLSKGTIRLGGKAFDSRRQTRLRPHGREILLRQSMEGYTQIYAHTAFEASFPVLAPSSLARCVSLFKAVW